MNINDLRLEVLKFAGSGIGEKKINEAFHKFTDSNTITSNTYEWQWLYKSVPDNIFSLSSDFLTVEEANERYYYCSLFCVDESKRVRK